MGFTSSERHGEEEAKEEWKRGWGIPVAGEIAHAGLCIKRPS